VNRLGLAFTAFAGLSSGAFGADVLVRHGAEFDPMLAGAIASGGLALAGLVAFVTRRPTPRRVTAADADLTRQRIRHLARTGMTPEKIARDTAMPRDVVMMALRATGDAPSLPTRSAVPAASAAALPLRPALRRSA
jgi:hypothetical protein